MLLVGRHKTRTCQGITRREVLQVGACSALGLSLAGRLKANPAAPAKQVLLVWLWGGPSQLDTFDPKPDAPLEYRGPYGTIATRSPGVRFGELFPKLANISNRFSIIRSMRTLSNDHGVAGTVGLTGSNAGALDLGGKLAAGSARPTVGSTVARVKGFAGKLPPFLVVGGKLHQGRKPIVGEGGGALGGLYDPFRLVHDPDEGTRVPALELPKELPPERLADRARLLAAMDRMRRVTGAAAMDDYRRHAFAMLTSPTAATAFDLGREKDVTRERYGLTRFGQSCLLGRRLIEAGVPFVQVNWSDHVEAEEDAGDGGWDHHYRNFQIMQDRHGPWLDRTLSTLIEDLHERGLLERTMVIAVGEFGRSPKINDKAGREHWEHCYSALVAGGGIKGGRVVGASDARAEHPRERPTTPADLIATVHEAIGVTSEQSQSLNIALAGAKVIEGL